MRRLGGLGLALALVACAPQAPPLLPAAPVGAGPGIVIHAAPVPEHPDGATQVTVCAVEPCGEWTFAGGLHLTSPATSRLHGLSDLDVTADGRLTALGDGGDLLEAQLVLDGQGRPAGLAHARLSPLTGLGGEPIGGKDDADAEGLAVLAAGRLVSFEHDHRIWLYPAAGGTPRAVPSPTASFPANGGMEALAPDPARGPDAYLVGIEDDGRTWLCRVSAACDPGPAVALPAGFGLVAARRLPAGRTAWLLRAWDPMRGNRIELRITDRDMRTLDALRIARPATVDNFEGVAAVPARDGTIRFYLLSDDNFAPTQRTLLLAFDWRPAQ